MKLIMLGPPGAGKGTQAQMLSDRLDIPAVSTGALFREAMEQNTPLGLKVKSYLDGGLLVPDAIVIDTVREWLENGDSRNGFILDGFPRTLPQAEALDEMGAGIDKVLYIHVADETIVDRLKGRRNCESCGAIYHLVSQPSSAGERCEKCGGALVLRVDDRPETVLKRLEAYHNQTAPLVEYYKKQGKLKVVEGQEAIESTTELTLEALGEQMT